MKRRPRDAQDVRRYDTAARFASRTSEFTRYFPTPFLARVSAAAPKSDLSLSEMLHVLDVARTLRRDSEIVDSELNKDELLASLKSRLIAAAEAAGDAVTEAEVEAAIRIYFQDLHKYADPPRSLHTVLAHLYVRRTLLLVSAVLCGTLVWGAWWLFLADGAPLSPATRRAKTAASQAAAVDATLRGFTSQLAAIRSLAVDPVAVMELDRLQREAAPAISTRDANSLERLARELADLEARLQTAYELLIVTGPGRRSGVDRGFGEKSAGYYLIVEARTAEGRLIPREITDRETGVRRRVNTWGEQVPQSVYERIASDKADDGSVDERLFAVKRRGWLTEEVRLTGEGGTPLSRGGQIADWSE